jgi:thiol-disulfide isomerase/thioredoxin
MQLAAARGGLADPAEQGEDLSRQSSSSRSRSSFNPASWIQVDGGFLPNLPRPGGRSRTVGNDNESSAALIRDVTNLADYKKVVVDENQKMTVVRFYAPWCRACRANQPLFQKLAAAYRHDPNVQFVQVPLTQETAVLQQGLGIPSLPYGHIYHHGAGLVEERKIGKTTFATFEKVLQTYVQGYCDVTYQENEENGASYSDDNNNGSGPLRP